MRAFMAVTWIMIGLAAIILAIYGMAANESGREIGKLVAVAFLAALTVAGLTDE